MSDKTVSPGKADERALYEAVGKVIEKYRDKPGSLIMVLHEAQR